MYYIANENHEIIAIDQAMLELVNASSFMDFYTKLQNKTIKLSLEDSVLKIMQNDIFHDYEAKTAVLQTIMGKIMLVRIQQKSDNQIQQDNIKIEDSELFPIDDNLDDFLTEHINEDSIALAEEDALLVDDFISSPDEVLLSKEETQANLTISPNTIINIDASNISKLLGISDSDYEVFLQEYIQTAYAFRASLESKNNQEKAQAYETLTHLSRTLHLPPEVNKSLELASKHENYDDFYDILDNIKIAKRDQEDDELSILKSIIEESIEEPEGIEEFKDEIFLTEPTIEETKDEPLTIKEPTLEILDTNLPSKSNEVAIDNAPLELIEPKVAEDKSIKLPENPIDTLGNNNNIDLLSVKPEHFDFQIKEAAKELSLPLDLVKEFMRDFIEQVHEETKNILIAYNEGELQKIQKLAHMLKGTSSNLRIATLADSLYELQLNEDIKQVEPLVKKYWGQFISFERLMNDVLNQGDEK